MSEKVQNVSLEMLFPPWTVTREVYKDSLTSRHSVISNDVLLFIDSGLSLAHHYRVHKRGLPHVAFQRNYMSQLRALLPLPAVLPIEGGSPDPACSSVVESPDVVCTSPRPSRRAIGRWRPTRFMKTPVRIAPRLTIQDPLDPVGAVVLDCRPQVLPWAMDVSGTYLADLILLILFHQKDYVEIRPEAPGVLTKDLINVIPIYCHHWDCGLRQVQVRQT